MDACMLSCFSHVQIFVSPWTTVVCHALLQVIFPTQELNLHLLRLLHCKWILYPLAPPGEPHMWMAHHQILVLSPSSYATLGNSFDVTLGLSCSLEHEDSHDSCLLLMRGERVNVSETLRPEQVSLINVSSSCCIKNTGEQMLVRLN